MISDIASIGFTIVKDVATSGVRLVTDTVLDAGNIITLGTFDQQIKNIKNTMGDVGINSLPEVIKKRFYSQLDKLEKDVKKKIDEVESGKEEIQRLEDSIFPIKQQLIEMLEDIKGLALDYYRYRDEINEKLVKYKDLDKSHFRYELKEIEDFEVKATRWNSTIQNLSIAHAGVAVSTGIAGLANTIANVIALTRIGRGVGAITTIARVAGRATIVLTAITEAIALGLTISELEKRLEIAKKSNQELDDALIQIRNIIPKLQEDRDKYVRAINELYNIEMPPLNKNTWPDFIQRQGDAMRKSQKEIKDKIDEYIRKKGG